MNMNDLPTTFYSCKKCSRVTRAYPFGCYEDDCPVKTDFIDDVVWNGIVFCVFMVLVGVGAYYLFGR